MVRPSFILVAAMLVAGQALVVGPQVANALPSSASTAVQTNPSSQRRTDDGYVINRQGFGNYVRGADGSFGGYPAGSAGAQELQMNQRYKCQAVPESC